MWCSPQPNLISWDWESLRYAKLCTARTKHRTRKREKTSSLEDFFCQLLQWREATIYCDPKYPHSQPARYKAPGIASFGCQNLTRRIGTCVFTKSGLSVSSPLQPSEKFKATSFSLTLLFFSLFVVFNG
jgi:hypothetical protein